jgi:hypothetical protein
MGRLDYLGCGLFSAPGRDYAECDLRFVGSFMFNCFAKNGVFTWPHSCPRHLDHPLAR